MTHNKGRYTGAEIELMFELRAQRIKWKVIAERIGRSQKSCEVTYCQRRKTRHAAALASISDAVIPVSEPLRENRTAARRISTSTLVADRELRSRIEVQGLTAGLLGDPPPGRSALDRKQGAS